MTDFSVILRDMICSGWILHSKIVITPATKERKEYSTTYAYLEKDDFSYNVSLDFFNIETLMYIHRHYTAHIEAKLAAVKKVI